MSSVLADLCIGPQSTIREALAAIDKGASSIALVIDDHKRLLGTVTDGDIRRGLLTGAVLGDPVLPHVALEPHVVSEETPRSSVIDLMRSLRISEVPVIDSSGVLTGLHTLNDMVGRKELPNHAIIMAGGRGTRLGSLTKSRPKPLMTVADKSIIEWIILGLVDSGIRDIHVSVAYLAEQIVDHLGDGQRLGCRISYIFEDVDMPLDTAGALGLFYRDNPNIEEPVVVTNADLMVRYDAGELLAFHKSCDAAVTVAARSYRHQVPFGVLEMDENRSILSITEKPTVEFEISTGIYVVSPDALAMVPYKKPYSMPSLMSSCLDAAKTVSAWPIQSDWIDVGTPKDLALAKGQ